ncbi:MAG: sialate O-acetylesterase [Planctomycetes bacterium]|nr:sialate O-acetylesterase [Planctomycetota bacterium]
MILARSTWWFLACSMLPAQEPTPARAGRLQVFVLAGQSNMQGHAKITTLDGLADDPATVPLLAQLRTADGKPRTAERVWISERTDAAGGGSGEGHGKLTAGWGARRDPGALGEKFGPEFAFGLALEQAGVGPVLIIKTAWGGKSLHTDFRPPSAGPFVFPADQLAALTAQGKDVEAIQAEKTAATGRYYREMIAHVRRVLADPARVCPGYDATAGYELAGFVWFQGWNDMVDRSVYPRRDQPDGYAAYSDLLAQLVRDVRKDLAAPQLPFVIGVMGVDGPVADGDRRRVVHRHFQAAMAAPAELPEFRGNVVAVRTAPFWPVDLAAIVDKVEQCKQYEHSLRKPKAPAAGAPPPPALSDAAVREAVAAFRARTITPAEEALLVRGVSNAAYHYLGCGRTMAQIGTAFAAAVQTLMKAPR